MPPQLESGFEESGLMDHMEKKEFREYLEFHGTFSDIPVDIILAAWEKAYGKDRVRKWIDDLEKV
jgi:hypothetical protein